MRELARAFAFVALLIAASPLAAQGRLVSRADYSKHIDPLLAVKDFGVEYSDDPHPPSVLFPRSEANSQERPRDAVFAILRLGPRGIPILIDCLSDGRVTGVRFAGNNIVRPMKVPVGYVCLDILLNVTHGGSVLEKNCPSQEGAGACVSLDTNITSVPTTTPTVGKISGGARRVPGSVSSSETGSASSCVDACDSAIRYSQPRTSAANDSYP